MEGGMIALRLPEELRTRVEAAARGVDMDLSSFVRGVLDITVGYSDGVLKDNFRILRNTEGLIKEAAKAYNIQRERYKTLGAATMAYSTAGGLKN